MIRCFFTLIFALGLTALSAAPRPNILYIYVDDMGWGSLGPNAQFARKEKGLPTVLTPNLDQLAARSVNFTRGYGCTVCSPARSSQQTGFHQGHTFADRNDPDNARKAIRADDVTIGDALSQAGYITGYWGKWGYGGSKDQQNPGIDNVQTLPTSHGYQHVVAELHHVRAHTFFQPTLWSAPAKPGATGGLELIPNSMTRWRGKSQYPNQPALQNHADYPEIAYCDDVYCFAALDFVRNSAKSGKPFFGLLAVQVPHAPFDEIAELPEWNRDYAADPAFADLKDQTKQWAAMVTRIDGHIGNLLHALEDPDNDGDDSDSIVDNTLVIFQSDNGGPGGPANQELDTNGGLRGTKGTIYEGGIRVPTLMSWPASKLQSGTSCSRIVDVSDLLPTFCELAGAEVPVGLDGVSFAPMLTGAGQQRVRSYIIHEAGKGKSIIRGKDKLIQTRKGFELYDLEKDHSEENDLSKSMPGLVKELKVLLAAERVDEPKGFANTYHHWIGNEAGKTSNPENWSDYRYSNAGITYMEDTGAPQLSWCATISDGAVARGDVDIELLGLHIRDGELNLDKDVHLTARNELRISNGGVLSIDGGNVVSNRWVDIKKGGEIRGSGKIEATIYNDGTIDLASAQNKTGISVVGNYNQSKAGVLTVSPQSKFNVSGVAGVGGKLKVDLAGLHLKAGMTFEVFRAKQITGKFSNPENQVITSDGTSMVISYRDNKITLTVESATDPENS